MATKRHQFIVGLIVKKIRENGYEIKALDGKYPGLLTESLIIPPKIVNHRPDVIGVNSAGQVCIGEAKTENDLDNQRIYNQLTDFARLELNGILCQVVVGIPQSAKEHFENILKYIGLSSAKNIYVLDIPNELINE